MVAKKVKTAKPKKTTPKDFSCKDDEFERIHPLSDEIEGSIRSPYARDRDRILFSKSFRRLAHKTQVYLTSENNPALNEHLRTRLTHTLEVGNLAKAFGSFSKMNLDLIEAIAYGHDVGHTPFGHAGEDQLDLFMNGKIGLPEAIASKFESTKLDDLQKNRLRDFGDFRHNFQSVRQLSFLFRYDPDKDGLNLTKQTLHGILFHTKTEGRNQKDRICVYPESKNGLFEQLLLMPDTIESRFVALADEIAQVCHDLSDAVELDVLSTQKFLELDIVKRAINYSQSFNKSIVVTGQTNNKTTDNIQITSALTEYFVRETNNAILAALAKATNINDALELIPKDPMPQDDFKELQNFKDNLVINNYFMNRMDNKGKYIIRQLMEAYLSDPRQLPDSALKMYLRIKHLELNSKSERAFRDWFDESLGKYGILETYKLNETEKDTIIKLIRMDPDGSGIRKLDAGLFNKLMPYFAVDADYIRTIVDHIGAMTDVFAEHEFTLLYGY